MQTFPSQTVRLNGNAGKPIAQFTFGHANVSKFSIHEWNFGTSAWDPLFAKPTVDAPDSYEFALPVAQWGGNVMKFLAWQESAIAGSNVLFSVKLTIQQDGVTVPGGDFPPSADKDTEYQAFFKLV